MKIALRRLLKDEKGKVLIIVLILLVVGSSTMTPLLSLMSTGLRSGQVYETKMHEYYAADAGVEDAIWKILNDVDELPNSSCGNQSWSYNYSITDINNKDVDVAIDYSGGLVHLIESTATDDDDSSTTVYATITLDVEITEGSEFFDSDWTDFDDFGSDDFDEDGNYFGDVHTDGDVEVIIDGTIYGNVWAEDGDVKVLSGGSIQGDVVAHGDTGHAVDLGEDTVINGTVCAQYIILEKRARITGHAYATCNGAAEMCETPYVPCTGSGTSVELKEDAIIEGSAYSENDKVLVKEDGARIWGDAYAAEEVEVDGGGEVVGTIYDGYGDWEGCPLCGTQITVDIEGVGIGHWEIE